VGPLVGENADTSAGDEAVEMYIPPEAWLRFTARVAAAFERATTIFFIVSAVTIVYLTRMADDAPKERGVEPSSSINRRALN
jgi:O-methyltransferase involved in polyketide biosynthesis